MIPHGTQYWFQSISQEPLVIARVSASAEKRDGDRVYIMRER